jgi:hypothetical protein
MRATYSIANLARHDLEIGMSAQSGVSFFFL